MYNDMSVFLHPHFSKHDGCVNTIGSFLNILVNIYNEKFGKSSNVLGFNFIALQDDIINTMSIQSCFSMGSMLCMVFCKFAFGYHS